MTQTRLQLLSQELLLQLLPQEHPLAFPWAMSHHAIKATRSRSNTSIPTPRVLTMRHIQTWGKADPQWDREYLGKLREHKGEIVERQFQQKRLADAVLELLKAKLAKAEMPTPPRSPSRSPRRCARLVLLRAQHCCDTACN